MQKIKTQFSKISLLILLLIGSGAISSVSANLPTRDTAYDINQESFIGFSNTKTQDAENSNNNKENTYIEIIAHKLHTLPNKTQKNLIYNYCNAVLNTPNPLLVGEGEQQFMYDPKQSMFVLSLCTSIIPSYDRYFPFLQNEDGRYYKKYTLADFGMPIYEGSSCSTTGDMNTCQFHKYIPEVFNQTINDYINIKQATILGVQNPNFNEESGKKIEKQANDLMKTRFYDQMLCDLNGEKNSKCNYPKTMKYVKDYISKSAKLIKQAKVINYEQIYKDATKENITKECGLAAKAQGDYNIIMCGLIGEKQAHMQAFMNVLYNELFYYRLFITYYSTDITVSDQDERANKMRQELIRSQDAIDLSLQMLKELYFAYPIHLGFTLYIEDLISLRKELVKIVTPISTLYDKLRNVQEKSN